ncbi:hypothetical protein QL285_001793 [Trifolium repens]|nr:hypothetical protein QL285_001793 [Trifolium repens]
MPKLSRAVLLSSRTFAYNRKSFAKLTLHSFEEAIQPTNNGKTCCCVWVPPPSPPPISNNRVNNYLLSFLLHFPFPFISAVDFNLTFISLFDSVVEPRGWTVTE